jgi:arylsulfatase A-like enzyme
MPVREQLTGAQAIRFLIAVGTLAGLARVAGFAILFLGFHRLIRHGLHLVWMAPLGATLFVGAWGWLIWLAGARLPHLRTPAGFAIWVLWFPGASLMLDISGLHPAAGLIFAIGAAVAFGRFVPLGTVTARRWVSRLSVFGGALSIALLLLMMWRQFAMVPAEASEVPSPTGPNVILVVLDTVRADTVGGCTPSPDVAPVLGRLMASGVCFSQAFAPAPLTTPSHVSLMTGLWPGELNLNRRHGLAAGVPTVAESLRGAGYLTAGFVANVQNAGFSTGIARGFSRFEDYTISPWNLVRGFGLGQGLLESRWFLTRLSRNSTLERKRSPEVSQEFLAWLRRQPDRPFFAFLNYFDAHDPYEAPPDVERRFGLSAGLKRPENRELDTDQWSERGAVELLQAYKAAVSYQDEQLDALFIELEHLGKLQNTLLIVTSDHGEEFYEHRLMRHGNSLYRAAVHVPLVVSFPGRVQAGSVVTTPVSLRSIAATIAAIVPGPEAGKFRGPGLLELMNGEPAETLLLQVEGVPGQPESFPVHFGPIFGVVAAGHKYTIDGRGIEELFALADESDRFNLATAAGSDALLPRFRELLAGMRAGKKPAKR